MRCPRCGRDVQVERRRFVKHGNGSPWNPDPCPMQQQLVPITGDTPADHEDRAGLITDLAWQVQDSDPHVVWEYLTALPAAELQRLLMFSLAALPVDKTVHETWAWVKQLPTARFMEAV